MRLIAASAMLLAFAAAAPMAFAQTAAQNPLDIAAEDQIEKNCQMCHAMEMITQQRLEPKAWMNEVEKMRKWGAPLDQKWVLPVAGYLAHRYSTDAPPHPSDVISPGKARAAVMPSGRVARKADAERGSKLYAESCASCHGTDARGKTGPNLVLQPVLFQRNGWREAILNGRGIMPTFKGALDDSQIDDIAAWVRTLEIK